MKLLILTSLILAFATVQVSSQCSDAGVCSIGHVASDFKENKKNQIGAHYILGYSTPEDQVTFHTLRIDGSVQIMQSTQIFWQFPFLAIQDGPAGSVSGIGDLIVSVRQKVIILGMETGIHAGVKLATGNANKNDHLPQIYQPGLGTNDLLLGFDFDYKRLNFLFGYQLTENKRNDNALTRLKRGDDLMARISYNLSIERFVLSGDLLTIKRLQKSSVLTGSKPNEEYQIVPESDQLQINLGVGVLYRLRDAFSIKGQLISALLSRKVNVDGLTRGITISFGGIYSF